MFKQQKSDTFAPEEQKEIKDLWATVENTDGVDFDDNFYARLKSLIGKLNQRSNSINIMEQEQVQEEEKQRQRMDILG